MAVEDRKLQNEMIFRDSNERIRRAQRKLDTDVELVPFICECSDISCQTIVLLTAEEYEHVRGENLWFFIAPGHGTSDGTVVNRAERYWILEKS
jgi:hypothetical protein